jgi:hypothetical protein
MNALPRNPQYLLEKKLGQAVVPHELEGQFFSLRRQFDAIMLL